jgi:ATP-dependent DNA helicase DinG
VSSLAARVAAAFDRLVDQRILSERRTGQIEMAVEIAEAIDGGGHVLVSAGTGVGKTWAYLVPAILSERRTVVSTATRTLQEQLAQRDLPLVRDALQGSLTWSVLKGRSNYLCRQCLAETATTAGAGPSQDESHRQLMEWASTTATGDRDELSWEPEPEVWRHVSVRPDECPGKTRCPFGDTCFTEQARRAAASSQIVVTNHHVYAAGLFSSQQVLPEHSLAIFDEAHQVDEVFRQASSTWVDPVRAAQLVRRAPVDSAAITGAVAAFRNLRSALAPAVGTWMEEIPDAVAEALTTARDELRGLSSQLRLHAREENVHRSQRLAHTMSLIGENLSLSLQPGEGRSIWVQGSPAQPVLRTVSEEMDMAAAFAERGVPTVVLTSATIAVELPAELGFEDDQVRRASIVSPFAYQQRALLYCAMHSPDPRSASWTGAVHDELIALIEAAGGRTLALFTSWTALESAVEAVESRIEGTILVQGTLGKRDLLERFRSDTASCAFGTIGLAQGIDIPGEALNLVTIDRLPFPPVNDPYLGARRAAKGQHAFRDIDLRHARTVLAQAAGRLIRTETDWGVVAVLDPRLGTAPYRWDLVNALPPMRRTRSRDEAVEFLRSGGPALQIG